MNKPPLSERIEKAIDYVQSCVDESIEDGEAVENSSGYDVPVNCYMMNRILKELKGEPYEIPS